MKFTALGVNNAFGLGTPKFIDGELWYKPKWQSNFLFEFDTPGKINKEVTRLVLDFGGDIRHSLICEGLKMGDIDMWYCSHPHADHIGGLEGIGLSTFFNPYWSSGKVAWFKQKDSTILDRVIDGDEIPNECKPTMLGQRDVLKELWSAGRPGLNTLQAVNKPSLNTYFQVKTLDPGVVFKIEDGDRVWEIFTLVSAHVIAGMDSMPSYGVFMKCSDGQKLLFPTDTLYMMPYSMETFYKQADVIYHDCETGPNKSGVHTHIDVIREADPAIKSKCYLYHYDEEPVVDPGEFKGILRRGDKHIY